MIIYKSEDDQKRIEENTNFSGSALREASLGYGMLDWTLKEIAEYLMKDSDNIAGVEIHHLTFTYILHSGGR